MTDLKSQVDSIEIVADIEKSAVELGYSNSKAFAVGSCKEIFCHDNFDCRVLSEGKGCRHYQYARPPIEAFGINVNELAKTAGWSMNRDTDEADTDKVSMGAVYGLVLIG